MSLDDLPECLKTCLIPAGKSAGCSETDVDCLCHQDLEASEGSKFVSCTIDECGLTGSTSASNDLLELCAQVTGSSSKSSEPTATSTASSRESSTESTIESSAASITSASTTSSASTTNAIDPGSDTGGSSSSSGGLSTGAKAGIGVGAAIAVILMVLGAYVFGRRRRRKSDPSPVLSESPGEKGALELGSNERNELEGERWIPELTGQHGSRHYELEANSPAVPTADSAVSPAPGHDSKG